MTDCRYCQPPEDLDVTPGRHPWGDGPAPAWHCRLCGHHIGRRRWHHVVRGRYVLCGRCDLHPASHRRLYPDCPDRWHDLGDHPLNLATRGGAWRLLLEAFESRYERVG
jgi:hypothetical protein